MKRRFMKQSLAALALLGGALGAAAQATFPAKTLNYVVPYPPGGTTDIIGRTLAQRLGPALGSTVVVDNKAGATGTIGGAFVARAPADGNTLLGTSIGPQAIVPHLMPSVPYDAAKAYAPVVLVGTVPHLLVVAAGSPYKTLAELLAAAKAKPGELSFASGGNGTILQMQGELLRLHAGVEMVHVPYKGDTPALQDVMGGQATFVFAPIAAALPQVPTMVEAGVKDFVVEQWQAVYAPAGTPAAVVQRLNHEINQILKEREVVASFDKLGVTIVGGTPQQLAERQKADSERWGRVIKATGIKLD